MAKVDFAIEGGDRLIDPVSIGLPDQSPSRPKGLRDNHPDPFFVVSPGIRHIDADQPPRVIAFHRRKDRKAAPSIGNARFNHRTGPRQQDRRIKQLEIGRAAHPDGHGPRPLLRLQQQVRGNGRKWHIAGPEDSEAG